MNEPNAHGSAYNRIVEAARAAAKAKQDKLNLIVSTRAANSGTVFGCINPDMVSATLSTGETVKVTIIGQPPRCCPMIRIGPGQYLAQGPQSKCITIASRTNSAYLILNYYDGTKIVYFICKVEDASDVSKYYPLDIWGLFGLSPTDYYPLQVRFSPSGLNIFVAFQRLTDNNIVTYGVVNGWSLNVVDNVNVVKYTSFTVLNIDFNITAACGVVVPSVLPEAPPNIPDHAASLGFTYSYSIIGNTSYVNSDGSYAFSLYEDNGTKVDIIGIYTTGGNYTNQYSRSLNGITLSGYFSWTNSNSIRYMVEIVDGSVSYFQSSTSETDSILPANYTNPLSPLPTVVTTTSSASASWEFATSSTPQPWQSGTPAYCVYKIKNSDNTYTTATWKWKNADSSGDDSGIWTVDNSPSYLGFSTQYILPYRSSVCAITDQFLFVDTLSGPTTSYSRPSVWVDGSNKLPVKPVDSTSFQTIDLNVPVVLPAAPTSLTQKWNISNTPHPNTVSAGPKVSGSIFDQTIYTLVDYVIF